MIALTIRELTISVHLGLPHGNKMAKHSSMILKVLPKV